MDKLSVEFSKSNNNSLMKLKNIENIIKTWKSLEEFQNKISYKNVTQSVDNGSRIFL